MPYCKTKNISVTRKRPWFFSKRIFRKVFRKWCQKKDSYGFFFFDMYTLGFFIFLTIQEVENNTFFNFLKWLSLKLQTINLFVIRGGSIFGSSEFWKIWPFRNEFQFFCYSQCRFTIRVLLNKFWKSGIWAFWKSFSKHLIFFLFDLLIWLTRKRSVFLYQPFTWLPTDLPRFLSGNSRNIGQMIRRGGIYWYQLVIASGCE